MSYLSELGRRLRTAGIEPDDADDVKLKKSLLMFAMGLTVAAETFNPVIVDFYKEGLKIIGPGTAVTREFAQKNPNTIRAFLMGLLDGVKRAIDDEEYASKLESKYSKVTDAKILADNYQQGLRVWNKDLTVDPAAIRVVLDDAPDGRGKGADPKRFYDNSFIQAVNRDHASKLFPGEVK